MQSGPIVSLTRELVVSHADRVLETAWRTEPGGQTQPAPQAGPWWSSDLRMPELEPAVDVPMLLFWTPAVPLACLGQLANAATRAPLYMIAGDALDDQEFARLVPATANVLVRRVATLPCAGVIVANGAHLWLAGAGQPCRWRLTLDAAQAEALRPLFLRGFWHGATEQMWHRGGRWSGWTAPSARPFDVPLPSLAARAIVDDDPTADLYVGAQTATALHAARPPARVHRGQRLWTTPSGNHHPQWARATTAGAEVVAADLGVADCWTNGTNGKAQVVGEGSGLQLTLNPSQAQQLAAILAEPAAWRFAAGLPLGVAAAQGAQIWLAAAEEPRPCTANQQLAAGEVQCRKIGDVSDAQPGNWPDADPLALQVTYLWQNLPPRLPTGSADDALVGQWQRLDRAFVEGCDTVAAQLATAKEASAGLGRRFASWVGASVGFGAGTEELEEALQQMRKQTPSSAADRAQDLLAQLDALKNRASVLSGEIASATAQAREEKDRQDQQAAWRAQQVADERSRETALERRATAEAKRASLETERAAVDAELETAEGKVKADLRVKHKRTAGDIAQVEREIDRLNDKIAALEEALARPFSFAPTPVSPTTGDKKSGRFVPGAATASPWPVVPSEALPAVGQLKSCKGKRYLVIADWADLEAGEQAAERLGADLVARSAG